MFCWLNPCTPSTIQYLFLVTRLAFADNSKTHSISACCTIPHSLTSCVFLFCVLFTTFLDPTEAVLRDVLMAAPAATSANAAAATANLAYGHSASYGQSHNAASSSAIDRQGVALRVLCSDTTSQCVS